MRIQKRRLNSAFPQSCMLEKVLANRRTLNADTRALAIECLREVRGEANIHVLIYLENKGEISSSLGSPIFEILEGDFLIPLCDTLFFLTSVARVLLI